jgi:hypothetical protein
MGTSEDPMVLISDAGLVSGFGAAWPYAAAGGRAGRS